MADDRGAWCMIGMKYWFPQYCYCGRRHLAELPQYVVAGNEMQAEVEFEKHLASITYTRPPHLIGIAAGCNVEGENEV